MSQNDWKVSFDTDTLPKYDEKGRELHYYMAFDQSEDPTQKVQLNAGDNGDVYNVNITNPFGFFYSNSRLYNQGVVYLTLSGKTDVSFTKVWDDGDNASIRPDITPQMYLLRIEDRSNNSKAEDPWSNTKDSNLINDVANAFPVEDHDKQTIPTGKNEKGEVVGSQFQVVFADDSDLLDKYNGQGQRYIYFALERGAIGGDYVSHVSYPDNYSEYSQSVRDFFKYNFGDKYVLNHGTITNKLEGIYPINATVVFKATAMQNMQAAVKLKLQKKNEKGEWVDAVPEDLAPGVAIPKSDTLADKTSSVYEEDGHVVMRISGFGSESPQITGEGPNVNKYTDGGKPQTFRWVESAIAVNPTAGTSGGTAWIPGNEGVVGWTDIPAPTAGEDGSLKYSRIDAGEAAPGAGGQYATAYFQPEQNDGEQKNSVDSYITNTLQGQVKVQIRKQWFIYEGETVDRSADKNAVGDHVANFTVSAGSGSEDGVMGAQDSQSQKLYFDSLQNDEDKNEWVSDILTYDRYDANGAEYGVSLSEDSVKRIVVDADGNKEETDLQPGESWDKRYSYETTVVPDGDGNSILLYKVHVVNHWKGSRVLTITIQNNYRDGSDSLTRHPVYVDIIDKNTGKIAKLNNGKDAHITLDAADNYYEKVYLDANDEEYGWDVADNYVVRETKVGEAKVVYNGAETDAQVITKIKDYQDKGSENQIAPYIGSTPDEKHLLSYIYDVSITRTSASDENADYTITNLRHGVMNLQMTKTWNAGGLVLAGTFKMERTVNRKDYETVSTFTIPDRAETDGGSYMPTVEKNVDGKSTVCRVSFENLPKYDEEGEQYLYSLVETKIGDTELGDLTKEEKEKHPTSIKRTAMVEWPGHMDENGNPRKDQYESSTRQVNVDIKGAYEHHSGDLYEWVANNTRTQDVSLVVNKVWRDDGSRKLDVRFHLLRLPISDTEYDQTIDLEQYCYDHKDEAQQVGGDKFWDTIWNDWCWSCDIGAVPKYAPNGDRYLYFLTEAVSGGQGDYRTYYYNGSIAPNKGKSETVKNSTGVLNGADTKAQEVSEENNARVNDEIQKKKTYPKNGVLMLYDHTDTDGSKYSKTVINVRDGHKKIEGEKEWNLPKGWKISGATLPQLRITLYRSTDRLWTMGKYTEAQLKEWIKEQKVEPAKDYYGNDLADILVNKEGKEDNYYKLLHFESVDLPKYDENGRTYYYYVKETVEKTDGTTTPGYSIQNYPDESIEVNANNYTLRNTYKMTGPYVQFVVNKTWKSERHEIDASKLAPVRFELCVKFPDPDPNTDPDPQPIAVKTLSPAEAAEGDDPSTRTTSLTFTTVDEDKRGVFVEDASLQSAADAGQTADSTSGESSNGEETSGNQDAEKPLYIPYYGPDGKPLTYIVRETSPANGYITDAVYDLSNTKPAGEGTPFPKDNPDGTNLSETRTSDPNNPMRVSTATLATATAKYEDAQSSTIYKETVSFKNTYTGDPEPLTVEKIWANDSGYTNYRPHSLKLVVGRSWPEAVVNDTTMSGGKDLNSDGSEGADVNVTKSGQAVRLGDGVTVNKAAAEEPNKWTWTTDTAEGASTTENQVSVPTYAPNGQQYTYYVADEHFFDEGALKNSDEKYKKFYEGEAGAGAPAGGTIRYTNTFRTTKFTVAKHWLNSANSDAEIDETLLKKLHGLGFLPNDMTLTLMRKVKGVDNSYAAAGELPDAEGALKDTSVIVLYKYFASYSSGKELWRHLPEYDLEGNPYQYSVQEQIGDITYLAADDGTETEFQQYSSDSRYVGQSESSSLQPDVPEVNEKKAAPSAVLNNKLNLTKVTFIKTWAGDQHNRDNTRQKVTFNITATGKGIPEEGNLTKVDIDGPKDPNTGVYKVAADSWKNDESNYPVYLPTPKAEYATSERISEVYAVQEDQATLTSLHAKKYQESGPVWTWTDDKKSCEITNTLNSVPRATIDFTATKIFRNDQICKDVTRPDIRFQLYFLKQGGNENKANDWVAIDQNNYSQFSAGSVPEGAGLQKVTITDADGTGTGSYTWSGLYKYWTREDTEVGKGSQWNHPEPIQYKVEEVFYSKTNPEVRIASNQTAYSAEPPVLEKNEVDVSDTRASEEITNTLVTDNIYVQKKWKNGSVTKSGNNYTVAEQGNAVGLDTVKEWIALQSIPSNLKLQLQYRLQNGSTWTEWTDYPGSQPTDYAMNKVVQAAELKNLEDIKVPAYDKDGHKIQYSFEEKDPAEGSAVTYTYHDKRTNGATRDTIGLTAPKKPLEVTNVLATGELSVNKTWVDGSDRDGLRGDVTYQLYRDNRLVSTVKIHKKESAESAAPEYELTSSEKNAFDISVVPSDTNIEGGEDSYTITWKNLPVFQNGKDQEQATAEDLSKYYVVESEFGNGKNKNTSLYDGKQYTNNQATVSGMSAAKPVTLDTAHTIGIVNIHKMLTADWTAEKHWMSDEAWRDQTRFNVYGTLLYHVDGIDKENEWHVVDKTISTKDDNGYYYYTEAGRKVYADIKKAYSTDSVTQLLYNAATGISTTGTWRNLPQYADHGHKITYRVAESKSDAENAEMCRTDGKFFGYDAAFVNTQYDPRAKAPAGSTKITNTLQTTSIKVNKEWFDENDRDNMRPDHIEFTLLRDGQFVTTQPEDKTVKGNDTTDAGWTYTWRNLPVCQNGSESWSHYQIKETPVNSYTTKVLFGSKDITDTTDAEAYFTSDQTTGTDIGATITVRNTHTPAPHTDFTATKIWNDKAEDGTENKYRTRTSVDVLLQYSYKKDGTWTEWANVDNNTLSLVKVNGKPTQYAGNGVDPRTGSYTGHGVYTTDPVKKTLSDGSWTFTWKNLRAYTNQGCEVRYRAVETTDGEHAIGADTAGNQNVTRGYKVSYSPLVPDKDTDQTSITNKLITGSLTVHKIWDDESNRHNVRPDTITYELYRDGKKLEGDTVIAKGNAHSDADWSHTWTRLPVYTYDSTKTPALQKSKYTVVETCIGKAGSTYTVTYDGKAESPEATLTEDPETGAGGMQPGSIKAASGTTIEVVNKYEPARTQWSAEKSWDEESDRDNHFATRKNVYARLQFHVDGRVNKDGTPKWEYVTGNAQEADYDDGMKVLTKDSAWMLISEQKTGEEAPTLIKAPHQNGTTLHTVTWKNLPADVLESDGNGGYVTKAVSYRAVETDASGKQIGVDAKGEAAQTSGYMVSYDWEKQTNDDTDQTTTITNALQTASIAVTKHWEDENNRDGVRPESITYTLYRDGKQIDQQTIYRDGDTIAPKGARKGGAFSDNGWGYTWTGLPIYTMEGRFSTYRIDETLGQTSVSSQYTTTIKAGEKDVKNQGFDLKQCTDDNPRTITVTNTRTVDGKHAERTTWKAVKTWKNDTKNFFGTRGDRYARLQFHIDGVYEEDQKTESWEDIQKLAENNELASGTEVRTASERWQLISGQKTENEQLPTGASEGEEGSNTYLCTATWTDLPTHVLYRDASGKVESRKVSYRAVETDEDGKEIKNDTAESGGYQITYPSIPETVESENESAEKKAVGTEIVNTLETRDLTVIVNWHDQSDIFGLRPADLKIEISNQNGKLNPHPKVEWLGRTEKTDVSDAEKTDVGAVEKTDAVNAVKMDAGAAEKMYVNVSKKLDAADADSGITPADGKEVTVEKDTWKYVVSQVPKYLPGTHNPAVYKVTQKVPEYYTSDTVTDVEEDEKYVVTLNENLKYGGITFTKLVTPYENCSVRDGKTEPLEGATFKAVLQRQGKAESYDKPYYGDSHRTFTASSDKNGRVFFSQVPVGSYTVKETVAPKNVIVRNDDWTAIVKYQKVESVKTGETVENDTAEESVNGTAENTGDQPAADGDDAKKEAEAAELAKQPVSLEDAKRTKVDTIVDEVVRTDISLKKVSSDKETEALPGALFGLYREITEDERADYKEVKEADDKLWAKIAEAKTDEYGELTFKGVLMDTTYRVYEEKAPDGWYTSRYPAQVVYKFDPETGKMSRTLDPGTYKGKDTVKEGKDGVLIWPDLPVTISIKKVNPDGDMISGAKLQIKEQDTGKVVHSWVTDGKAESLRALLKEGRTYVVEELEAPEGYLEAASVPIKVSAEPVAPGERRILKVEMIDEVDAKYWENLSGEDDGTDSGADANGSGDASGTTGSDKAGSVKGVKTGDDSPVGGFAGLMLGSLGLIVLLYEERRRRARENR